MTTIDVDRRIDSEPDPDSPLAELRPDYVPALVLGGALVWLGVAGSWSYVFMVLAFAAMIFLHELGHFVMAKRAGMKVTEFFLGFGPKLWSFRRGETEYGVKAVVAGGYVKIAGMNNLDPVDPGDESRTYRHASYPARMGVAVAGSTVHYLLALVSLFALFSVLGQPDESDWLVEGVIEGSAADQAGLLDGDRLLAVGDTPVETFGDLAAAVEPLAGQPTVITVERDGSELELAATIGERLSALGAAGIEGLVEGDRLVSIDGAPVTSWSALLTAVEVGGTYEAEIIVAGELARAEIVVNRLVTDGAVNGFLGIGADAQPSRLGPLDAARESGDAFVNVVRDSITGVGTLFSPSGIRDLVSEPIVTDDDDVISGGDAGRLDPGDEGRVLSIVGGVRIGGQAAERGADWFLSFFAVLNIFVGTFNLVPLPPFDGGHVIVGTYERLRSRAGRRYHADATKLLPITYAVLALLLLIFVFSGLRDILDPVDLPS